MTEPEGGTHECPGCEQPTPDRLYACTNCFPHMSATIDDGLLMHIAAACVDAHTAGHDISGNALDLLQIIAELQHRREVMSQIEGVASWVTDGEQGPNETDEQAVARRVGGFYHRVLDILHTPAPESKDETDV